MKNYTLKKISLVCLTLLTCLICHARMQENNDLQVLNTYIEQVLKMNNDINKDDFEGCNLVKNDSYFLIKKIKPKLIIESWNTILSAHSDVRTECILQKILYSDMGYDGYCEIVDIAIELYKGKILNNRQFINIYTSGEYFFVFTYTFPNTINRIEKIIDILSNSNEKESDYIREAIDNSMNIMNGKRFFNNLRYMVHNPSKENIKRVQECSTIAQVEPDIIWYILSQTLGYEIFFGFSVYDSEPLKRISAKKIISKSTILDIQNFLSTEKARTDTINGKIALIEDSFNLSWSSFSSLKSIFYDSKHTLSLAQKKMIIDVIINNLFFKEQIDFVISLLNEEDNDISKYIQSKLSKEFFNNLHIEKEKIVEQLKTKKHIDFQN